MKAVFTVGILFCLGASDAVANDEGPNTGYLHQHSFVSDFDAICGLGKAMSKGCEAIRGREIVDASSVPWRAIGRVNFSSIQIRHHCTGTLVSERIVLTAAHCLYNSARKMWIPPEAITFVAGFQRGSGLAVSRGQRFVLNEVEDLTSRDFQSAPHQDWALLVLQDPIGRDVGYLDIFQSAPKGLEQWDFKLAGYTGLRPNALSVASDCGLPLESWPNTLLQRCSAMRGDSGAPLLVVKEDDYLVVGVFSSIVSRGEENLSLSVAAAEFLEPWSIEYGK
ncbi:trypsin-like serine protease [uncultured Pelagimonas sp.]|uniref:trypsin-like serine peptidase n=1 Tax=uncultured Pelagimonas sp. TaxID=1618102 RepID=UPI00263A1C01|nr:trypsin-like serine protease [uncultured Pelagimonas sp.]